VRTLELFTHECSTWCSTPLPLPLPLPTPARRARAARATTCPPGGLVRESITNSSQSIRGILHQIRCRCDCADADAFVRDAFNTEPRRAHWG
jgi:hypothetical protein